MSQVEIISEDQVDRGWTYTAQVLDESGGLSRHEVHLSWADYNHWSAGGDAPARVAEAAIIFLLTRQSPDELPKRFDVSVIRRLHPEADEAIPAMIRDFD